MGENKIFICDECESQFINQVLKWQYCVPSVLIFCMDIQIVRIF